MLPAHLVSPQVRLVDHPTLGFGPDDSLDGERPEFRLESLLADSSMDGLAGDTKLFGGLCDAVFFV